MQTENRVVDQHKRKFLEFLGSDETDGKYIEKIKNTIQEKKFRLIVNINELRSLESNFSNSIIRRPREFMIALQDAANETAKSIDPSFEKVLKSADLQVGFEGSLGNNSVSPRGLVSSLLNSLVEVEGIVTKCSSVRSKLVRSVQYCPATKQYVEREYRDNLSLDIGIEVSGLGGERLPTPSTLPKEDANGNPLEIEYGLCKYKNCQTIRLQEMPEKARVGQLPRSIEVILENDLVDHAKPGDRITCIGVYRSIPGQQNGQSSTTFKTVLLCNNVKIIGKEIGAVRLTPQDVKNIRELSWRENVLEIMSRSLCPSIFGHEFIKKALILQLLSGCEKNLANGTHLRGDINIMLVGDPSTAKSQLLRSIIDIAPLAISTTGRGSSGVGLTAAVTYDPDSSEKRLEAGAMVLADRGIVCIDEFDKMSETDRVAIHEVMEQQTVTIAKAGIHASLNARCSVLAAANPVYGQYDKTRRPQENIGLPDSLLSRFDMLFIVLDQLDPHLDRTLSEHVIRSHQYRRVGTIMEPEPFNQTVNLNLEDDSNDGEGVAGESPVWQRGSGRVGVSESYKSGSVANGNRSTDVLTKPFLRKYLHYARNRIKPVLSDDAMTNISNAYTDMRSRQTKKNLPITPRTLETIIRIASASAKARLSNDVTTQDVDVAMELLNFVLFHEVGHQVENELNGNELNSQSKRVDFKNQSTEIDLKTSIDDPSNESHLEKVSDDQPNLQVVMDILNDLPESDTVTTNEILSKLNQGKKQYTSEDLQPVLKTLETKNIIMIVGNEIVKI